MIVDQNKFWIKFESPNPAPADSEAGKWYVFINRAYSNNKTRERENLIKIVDNLTSSIESGRAWIANDCEIALFFTSADRREITETKQIIMRELKVSDSNLLWKPNFETDDDWKEKTGILWFISEISEDFERAIKYLQNNQANKANRIIEKIPRLVTGAKKTLLQDQLNKRKSMIIKPSFPIPEYEIDQKLIFLLMPFNEKWSDDVHCAIKETAEEEGLKLLRGDSIFSNNTVIEDIWKLINRAGLVIADITVHNANVFYELGICHTLGKEVILLRGNEAEPAPFDIAFWRYFNYDTTSYIKNKEFKETLKKLFKNYINNKNEAD